MISDKVMVSDKGDVCDGLDAALDVVERTAVYNGFDDTQAHNLRFLAKEMVVGSAVMLDVFTGTMWAQTDDNAFQIVLQMEGTFTQVERDRLISLTRDNKNTLPKGFFAKLGVLLGEAFSGEYFYPVGAADGLSDAEMEWSAIEIADRIAEMERERDPSEEALGDEAKVVLDTYADDIKVAARATEVTLTVSKTLPARKA